MKKYTVEEFEAFQVVHGIKQCPSGDYSNIRIFNERCAFGPRCSFGEGSTFGPGCSFGPVCTFARRCYFETGCSFTGRDAFGEWCDFGERCSFGEWCDFGERCSFGEWCSFGELCSFGKWCRCEFGEFMHLYTFGGFGRESRTTYAFLLSDGGVGISCGCFHGNLQEFREIIHRTHAGTAHEILYNGVADLIELCMEEGK